MNKGKKTATPKKESVKEKKEKLERFFLDVFQLRVDLSGFIIPKNVEFDGLMFNPGTKLTEDIILSWYKKHWGEEASATDLLYPHSVSQSIDKDQSRPRGPYFFMYNDHPKVNVELLGYSFMDLLLNGETFMNVSERLLADLYSRYTYGDKGIWDNEQNNSGGTITSTLALSKPIQSSSICMTVSYNDGRIKIRPHICNGRMGSFGGRKILIVKK